MKGKNLVKETQKLLIANWPDDHLERAELALAIGCGEGTLNLMRIGRTKKPSAETCQRIIEHYTGKALLSA